MIESVVCGAEMERCWQEGCGGGITVDELKAFISASIPFGRTLGFEVVSISAEEAVFEVAYRDDLTQGGILHGGVLASLIDSVCACAAMARTYPQHYTTPINLTSPTPCRSPADGRGRSA